MIVRRTEVQGAKLRGQLISGKPEIADDQVVFGKTAVQKGLEPAVMLHAIGEPVARPGRCEHLLRSGSQAGSVPPHAESMYIVGKTMESASFILISSTWSGNFTARRPDELAIGIVGHGASHRAMNRE